MVMHLAAQNSRATVTLIKVQADHSSTYCFCFKILTFLLPLAVGSWLFIAEEVFLHIIELQVKCSTSGFSEVTET